MSHKYVTAAQGLVVGNPIGKSILLVLADMADADGFCNPSEPTIARIAEAGVSTVRKWLNVLEGRGYVLRIQGGHGRGDRNGYRLTFETKRRHDVAPNKALPGSETRHDVAPKNVVEADFRRYDVAEKALPGSKQYKEEPLENRNTEESSSNVENVDQSNPPITVAAKAAEKKGTRIPDQFLLTVDMRTWATKEGLSPAVDLIAETKKFVDYWRAKPGAAGRKLDWVATWRNWIRTAFERLPGYKQNGGTNGTKRTFTGGKDAAFDNTLDGIATDPAFGFASGH